MEIKHEPLHDETAKQIMSYCSGPLPVPNVKITLTGLVVFDQFLPYCERVLNLEIKEDDIWLVGLPRCGTNWTQEMIWLIKNDFNFEKANQYKLSKRFPNLLRVPLSDIRDSPEVTRSSSNDLLDVIHNLESPRFIKSHYHKQYLPRQLWTIKPKIIFVYRNPKDAAISLYHYYRLAFNYSGPLELFLKGFLLDNVAFNPFWKCVLDFWELRHEPNVLFLVYEEIQKDMPAVIRKAADFLEVEYTKEQEAGLLDHLSFSNMKRNKILNMEDVMTTLKANPEESFIRQGKVGDWRRVMSTEMIKMFDEWIEKNLEGSDFPRDGL